MARTSSFILMAMICAMQILWAAPGYGQGNEKKLISLDYTNTPIERIFGAIEQKADVIIMYEKTAAIKHEKASISVTNKPVAEVMDLLLKGLSMQWSIRGKFIRIENLSAAVEPVVSSPAAGDTREQLNLQHPIHGRVTDSTGAPLVGASVKVKGTNKGASTNTKGEFTIEANEGDILIISFVGFESQEVRISDQNVSVMMRTANSPLDEVQVIAYGTISQRLNTGNVTTVKSKDIEKSPVTNLLLAISGRVAGLNINQKTGYSGSGVVTLLQGQNSILRGSDPFYVVDGVPYPSQNLSIASNTQGVGGVNTLSKGSTINYINPADIESISVLKDADATAIYGSRAANGAILITTKKGKPGKTKVSLGMETGFSKTATQLDLMNTRQYLEMRHEALRNDGVNVKATDYDINGFWDTTRYTNWQKELIGNTAHYTTINGSVSGGTNLAQYAIGGTLHRETTVIPGDFSDLRGSVHFNLTGNTNDNRFQVQLSGNYMIDNNKLPNVDLTRYAVVLAPDAPALYNQDGSLNFMPTASGTSTFNNPLVELNSKFSNKTKNLVANLVLNYNILPGLNLRSSFGYTDMQTQEITQIPLSSYRPDLVPFAYRSASYGNWNISTWIAEPQLIYNQALGGGRLEVLIGSSIQRSDSKGNQLTGSGYNTDESLVDMNSATTLVSTGVASSTYKYAGLFGKINYTYAGRYMLNLSARRDGSSRFGPADRFHNFAALGAGWIFSEEKVIRDLLPMLSYGKLRFSYGTTGNDQIGDYQYMNLYFPVFAEVPYRGITGIGSNGLYNPYLQWELTRKINFGIDLGLLKDRLVLNANYYINRSSNQLMPYQLPSLTGSTSITTNYPATVQNSGWEFTLNGQIVPNGKFTWTGNVNVTIPRNKLIRFDNLASSSYSSLLIIGQPINITTVYTYAGVDPATGKYQFRDVNGNMTSNPNFATDKYNFVNTSPIWYGGLSNTFSYGGFSLDFLFQFMKRNGKNYFAGASLPGVFNINQPAILMDRWKNVNDIAGHQKFSANSSLSTPYARAGGADVSYSDASYCRLKNVSLSWLLPQAWIAKTGISSARIYTQGQNLLTITGYKGMDPETLSSTTLPPLKTLVFGLQLGF